jgi:hypothetical protein
MSGRLVRHVASFRSGAREADAALQLLAYLGQGSAVVFVHANGRIIRIENAIAILNCYVNSCASDDVDSYCGASFNHNPLPCAMLVALSREPEFFNGDAAAIKRHIKAAALRAECEWCPNFDVERSVKKAAM